MSKRREKSQALSIDETTIRLETRLREFEDRTTKKIKDLEDLVQYLTNKVYLVSINASCLQSRFLYVAFKHAWFIQRRK